MNDTLKEIIIEFSVGFFSNIKNEDKLRITENGIPYKKNNIYAK